MPIVKKSISLILCIALVFMIFPSFAFGAGVAARASWAIGASTAARAAASKAISKPSTKPPAQIRTNLIQTKGFQQICRDNQYIPQINTNKQNRTSLFNDYNYPYYITPPSIYYWPIFFSIDNNNDEDNENE